MKRTVAPFLRSDIFHRFGEVPTVAVKILSVVLALTIGVVLGFSQDVGAVLSRPLAMSLGTFDTNLDDVRIVRYNVAFRNGYAAVPSFHLNAMICDAEADGEAERLREPVSGFGGIGVYEHRDHDARRHRSVRSHPKTLSFTPLLPLANGNVGRC